MSAKPSSKPQPPEEQRPEERRKVIAEAIKLASKAVKDADKACAAAGLDRKAEFSLASSAMREAAKLAEDAVRIAIAQVDEAMDRVPHHRRSEP